MAPVEAGQINSILRSSCQDERKILEKPVGAIIEITDWRLLDVAVIRRCQGAALRIHMNATISISYGIGTGTPERKQFYPKAAGR
jgi:hypothetical protein